MTTTASTTTCNWDSFGRMYSTSGECSPTSNDDSKESSACADENLNLHDLFMTSFNKHHENACSAPNEGKIMKKKVINISE